MHQKGGSGFELSAHSVRSQDLWPADGPLCGYAETDLVGFGGPKALSVAGPLCGSAGWASRTHSAVHQQLSAGYCWWANSAT